MRTIENIALVLTAIRARIAGVAAPMLRRASAKLQRAADACEPSTIISPAKPVLWTTEGGLPFYDRDGKLVHRETEYVPGTESPIMTNGLPAAWLFEYPKPVTGSRPQ